MNRIPIDGVPYGSLKRCYELKGTSNETLNGLSLLNRPGLSFSNRYKDEFTDEDLYPALMDPISYTIHCDGTFCNKTCAGCLDYNCTTNDKYGEKTKHVVGPASATTDKIVTAMQQMMGWIDSLELR
ncbi:3127_t:CDS:2, partial [Diversispora eburnea]